MLKSSVRILEDDYSHIDLLDVMGGDLATVNGARVSYGKHTDQIGERDEKLIGFLGSHVHHTPFRHTYFQLRVSAPEFICRQWYKHVVGSEYAFKDLPWSEISQRYAEVKPQFYVPNKARGQSLLNKQVSEEIQDLYFQEKALDTFDFANNSAYASYQELLRLGVAREQARIVLPLSVYSEFIWTASLQAVVHFVTLREETGAQFEIRKYAQQLNILCRPYAPRSWDALYANHPVTLAAKLNENGMGAK